MRSTRVLIVDEWIQTGAQVVAAIDLIRRAGGLPVAVVCLHAHDGEGPRRIASRLPLVSLSGLSTLGELAGPKIIDG